MARKCYKYKCLTCEKEFDFPFSYNSILGKRKQFCCKKCYIEFQKLHPNNGWFKKGQRPSIKSEFKKGIIPWNKGKIMLDIRGKNHWNWQDGKTSENYRIRNSIEFRLWREAVFARDNWTCQKCGKQGWKLCAHHIQNFAQYPELRFAVDNGITFCKDCHKKFHRRYGIKKNTKEQIIEFLFNK